MILGNLSNDFRTFYFYVCGQKFWFEIFDVGNMADCLLDLLDTQGARVRFYISCVVLRSLTLLLHHSIHLASSLGHFIPQDYHHLSLGHPTSLLNLSPRGYHHLSLCHLGLLLTLDSFGHYHSHRSLNDSLRHLPVVLNIAALVLTPQLHSFLEQLHFCFRSRRIFHLLELLGSLIL